MFDKLDIDTLLVVLLIAIGIGLAEMIRNYVNRKSNTHYVAENKCIETHLKVYGLLEKIQMRQDDLRDRLPKEYSRITDYKEDISELKATIYDSIRELKEDIKILNEKVDRLLMMKS